MKTWGLVMVQFLGPKEYIVMNLVTMDSLFPTSCYGYRNMYVRKGLFMLICFWQGPYEFTFGVPFQAR